MTSLNRTELMGNLGADPEMRFTPNGNPVTNFRLASNRSYKVDEEWRQETLWMDVVCWNRLAESANEHLHKGSRVLVAGRLQQREWNDKDTGVKRTKIEIIASQVIFLDKADKDSSEYQEGGGSGGPQQGGYQKPQPMPSSPDFGPDDIPL